MTTIKFDESMSTPMWVRWNSKHQPTKGENLQKIFYLPQINQSPKSHSVILETMKRSQQLADECNLKCIAVTYDLAIAKVSMQTQAHESPKYDNIFVAMGAFHLEMAFFHAIGKYIEESGGPYLLVESGAIASNSVKNFLNINSYNSQKRLHGLLSLAFQILHYDSYMSSMNNCELKDIISLNLKHDLLLQSKELDEDFKSYSQYTADTVAGKHGKTTQFWVEYINFMNLPLHKKPCLPN